MPKAASSKNAVQRATCNLRRPGSSNLRGARDVIVVYSEPMEEGYSRTAALVPQYVVNIVSKRHVSRDAPNVRQ
jgi:hypothetical protein